MRHVLLLRRPTLESIPELQRLISNLGRDVRARFAAGSSN